MARCRPERPSPTPHKPKNAPPLKLSNVIQKGRVFARNPALRAAAKTHKHCSGWPVNSARRRKNRDLQGDLQARGMVPPRASRPPPARARRSLLGQRSGCYGLAARFAPTRARAAGSPAPARSRHLVRSRDGHSRAARAQFKRVPGRAGAGPGDRHRPRSCGAAVALGPPARGRGRRAARPGRRRTSRLRTSVSSASAPHCAFITVFTLLKFHKLNQRRSAHQG